MVSSRTGNYSRQQWLLQAIKVNIQLAAFSNDTFIFIQRRSANTPSDRHLLQGVTGQLFPANTWTAVGDTKHLDRLDWSKRQEYHFAFLYFSPRSVMLAQNTFSLQELAPVLHIGNVALRQCNFPWGIHKYALLAARTALHFYLGSAFKTITWGLKDSLCSTYWCMISNIWYQTSPNTLCFP